MSMGHILRFPERQVWSDQFHHRSFYLRCPWSDLLLFCQKLQAYFLLLVLHHPLLQRYQVCFLHLQVFCYRLFHPSYRHHPDCRDFQDWKDFPAFLNHPVFRDRSDCPVFQSLLGFPVYHFHQAFLGYLVFVSHPVFQDFGYRRLVFLEFLDPGFPVQEFQAALEYPEVPESVLPLRPVVAEEQWVHWFDHHTGQARKADSEYPVSRSRRLMNCCSVRLFQRYPARSEGWAVESLHRLSDKTYKQEGLRTIHIPAIDGVCTRYFLSGLCTDRKGNSGNTGCCSKQGSTEENSFLRISFFLFLFLIQGSRLRTLTGSIVYRKGGWVA